MNYQHWEQFKKTRRISPITRLYLRFRPQSGPLIVAENHPSEANQFWRMYFPLWAHLTEDSITMEMQDHMKNNLNMMLLRTGKKRFINKNPHHSFRVRLLNKIFPDAKFIHITRDGRAAAYSRHITKKVDVQKALGHLFRQDRSYLYNCGLLWQESVRMAREAMDYSERYYELKYEDLVRRPLEILKDVIDFCELEWNDEFKTSMPRMSDMNVKWKQNLTDDQKKDLEESTFSLRRNIGYVEN
jgi:sulfotransferase family protein